MGDVVRANILAAQRKEKFVGEAFNVASGEVHTNNQILEKFLHKFPDADTTTTPWRAGDVMHTQASISAAEKRLRLCGKDKPRGRSLFNMGVVGAERWDINLVNVHGEEIV